jgi:hypothetical protein
MENLKIKQRTEDMIKYGYIALRQFPKSEKFSMAVDIKKTMLSMLERIIRANRSRDRREALYAIDTELEILRTQVGVRMYVRYMDDFLVVHPDKSYLTRLLSDIDSFITSRLSLTLNPKTTIFKAGSSTCHSIDFCGYRIWPGYAKPRKRTVRSARKRLKRLIELRRDGVITPARVHASIMSFFGYMKHCNGKKTIESFLTGIMAAAPQPALNFNDQKVLRAS